MIIFCSPLTISLFPVFSSSSSCLVFSLVSISSFIFISCISNSFVFSFIIFVPSSCSVIFLSYSSFLFLCSSLDCFSFCSSSCNFWIIPSLSSVIFLYELI
uniref:Uncharacterized protein n=1 Tax=Cacopsylla melanoneura TaxID=428564 RepID=A0A8D8ZA79_9HEMI